MKNLESKAVFILWKRYIMSKSVLVLIVYYLLKNTLELIEVHFASELLMVAHGVMISSIIFDYLEKYTVFFIQKKSCFMIKRLVLLFTVQCLMSIFMGQLMISLIFMLINLIMIQVII